MSSWGIRWHCAPAPASCAGSHVEGNCHSSNGNSACANSRASAVSPSKRRTHASRAMLQWTQN
eukprot:14846114-Alexandrium_andersonii.AAC.1